MDKKKAIRWAVLCLSSFVAVVVLVPSFLVKSYDSSLPSVVSPAVDKAAKQSQDQEQEPVLYIPIYMSKKKTIESLPLERYVRGVLAAEMPIEFEPEALKAQAMAARTYIIRRIMEQDFSSVPVSGAWVTDTTIHQAYVSDAELKERWGDKLYMEKSDKLERAVQETEDKIITYSGKPIQANFFSTSNGYTENSEDYWNEYIPYLRSVPSPWDSKLSPRYKQTVILTAKELQNKLGTSAIVPVSTQSGSGFQVLELSQGHRIKKLRIAGKTLSGREVREKLGLNSSQFQWSWKGSNVEITTFGYGHGVGMSQWGANGMAIEGRSAEEIANYYYTGTQIEKASKLVKGNHL